MMIKKFKVVLVLIFITFLVSSCAIFSKKSQYQYVNLKAIDYTIFSILENTDSLNIEQSCIAKLHNNSNLSIVGGTVYYRVISGLDSMVNEYSYNYKDRFSRFALGEMTVSGEKNGRWLIYSIPDRLLIKMVSYDSGFATHKYYLDKNSTKFILGEWYSIY